MNRAPYYEHYQKRLHLYLFTCTISTCCELILFSIFQRFHVRVTKATSFCSSLFERSLWQRESQQHKKNKTEFSIESLQLHSVKKLEGRKILILIFMQTKITKAVAPDDKMKFKIYLNKEAIYKGTITCVGWSSNNEVYSCG